VFFDAFCGILAHECSPEIQVTLLRILRRCGSLFQIKDDNFLRLKLTRDNEQDEADAEHLRIALDCIKESNPTSPTTSTPKSENSPSDPKSP
jgi:geranylgeranyl pyrophosphate synthase